MEREIKYTITRFDTNGKATTEDVDYEHALRVLLNEYEDNDMTRDYLTTGANNIKLHDGWISAKEWNEEFGAWHSLLYGLWNLTPIDTQYDDNGNRIKKGE